MYHKPLYSKNLNETQKIENVGTCPLGENIWLLRFLHASSRLIFLISSSECETYRCCRRSRWAMHEIARLWCLELLPTRTTRATVHSITGTQISNYDCWWWSSSAVTDSTDRNRPKPTESRFGPISYLEVSSVNSVVQIFDLRFSKSSEKFWLLTSRMCCHVFLRAFSLNVTTLRWRFVLWWHNK
jgi:hypothetical protein